jgi:hypothetical protein
MKTISIILWLVLMSFLLMAQDKHVIRLKKINWKSIVATDDSVLWIGIENHMKIKVEGGMNYSINTPGGKIYKKNGDYIIIVDTEGAMAVNVYEQMPGKKARVICSKLFPVKRIPEPQIFVCHVKADSVIDKLQIIEENNITAFHPFYKKQLAVSGFDIVFSNGATTERLTSSNSHFTIEMRKRIYGLKPGTLLSFENVLYIMPDGSSNTAKPFEIFVTETNKYKVGYRVPGL